MAIGNAPHNYNTPATPAPEFYQTGFIFVTIPLCKAVVAYNAIRPCTLIIIQPLLLPLQNNAHLPLKAPFTHLAVLPHCNTLFKVLLLRHHANLS